ncbi:MAG: cytochrome c-type biogenesis protein CcmH [Vicinamibacterales bacterium]
MPLSVLLLGLSLAVQAPVDAAREARLQGELMAPCCWSQTVDIHHSPAADEVKASLHEMLAAGDSDDQVRAAFVAQYGKRILVVPPAEGFARTLYVLPWLLMALTGAGLALIVRRFASRGGAAAAVAARSAETPAERARLDDLLERMD